jgi:hypothetical protein
MHYYYNNNIQSSYPLQSYNRPVLLSINLASTSCTVQFSRILHYSFQRASPSNSHIYSTLQTNCLPEASRAVQAVRGGEELTGTGTGTTSSYSYS